MILVAVLVVLTSTAFWFFAVSLPILLSVSRIEKRMAITWLAPGAEAISEFARQHSGVWLHATCVETGGLECAIGQDPKAFTLRPDQIGDYLQQMVTDWRSRDPGVSLQGASSYVDATAWLRRKGFRVDENVFDANWWQTLQSGLRNHQVFLVGVTNAQGLPGDETGVHNHGFAALGIDANGNIICGDPDNWKAQLHMPSNPIGALVTYTRQDFVNGHISSLTRVYPMTTYTKDASGNLHYPNGVVLIGYMAAYVADTQHAVGETPLTGEIWYTATDAFVPFDGGTILTIHKDASGKYTPVQRGEGGQVALAFFQQLHQTIANEAKEEATEGTVSAKQTDAVKALVAALQAANLPAINLALNNVQVTQ